MKTIKVNNTTNPNTSLSTKASIAKRRRRHAKQLKLAYNLRKVDGQCSTSGCQNKPYHDIDTEVMDSVCFEHWPSHTYPQDFFYSGLLTEQNLKKAADYMREGYYPCCSDAWVEENFLPQSMDVLRFE